MLDVSEIEIYEFWYDYIKEEYVLRSLNIHIKT